MRIEAASMGLGVAQILHAGGRGTVIAAFPRSVYLRFPAGLVCLGAPGIGRGPLNLLCQVPVMFNWQGAARPGLHAVADESIHVGQLRIGLDSAAIWTPPPLPDWSGETARTGIAHLRAAMPPDVPEGGLGAILASPEAARRSDDPALRAAMPAIDALLHWVATDPAVDPPEPALCGLLGLGPGLTPSGDDFLGGVLMALRLAGHPGAADRLAHVVERLGPDRTNEISLAHLCAANLFGLAEKLQDVAADILRGEAGRPRAALVRLSDAAHHSPWDTLAGLITAFEALLGPPGMPSPKNRPAAPVGSTRQPTHKTRSTA